MSTETKIDDELIYIFDHMYQAFAHDLGEANGASMITRDDLFSICCDYFEVTVANERDIISEDAVEYWRALNWKEKHEYAPIVFEYEFYETGYTC
jgi:hypothetical protein